MTITLLLTLYFSLVSSIFSFTSILLQHQPERISIFKQISDPRSRSYGQYLSRDDIAFYFAPLSEHLDVVTSHLKSIGLDVTTNFAKDKIYIESKLSISPSELIPDDLLKTLSRQF